MDPDRIVYEILEILMIGNNNPKKGPDEKETIKSEDENKDDINTNIEKIFKS